jgi:hypothetical protein
MIKSRLLLLLAVFAILNIASAQVPKIQVGASTYDLQTNNSIQRRIIVDPVTKYVTVTYTGSVLTDGTYNDRGTGYAFYDQKFWYNAAGTIVTPPITAYPSSIRPENVRTGWPNPLNIGNKEIILSHISDGSFNGINMASRTRGTSSAWTNKKITAGAETWPRAASDGKNIVLISSYFGSDFEGVTSGIQYIVSTDSGNTWSAPAAFTGMDITNYPDGVGGDIYDVDIKGNTIAILMGRLDVTLYKSTNLGTTWTKTSIYSTQDNIDAKSGLDGKRGDRSDGSFSVIIDKNNKSHCFWGVQSSNAEAGTISLDLSRQGIGYWNEYMSSPEDYYIIPQTFFLKEGNFANSPIGRFNTTLNDGSTITYFNTTNGNPYGNTPVTWPSSGLDSNGVLYLTYAYNRGKIDSTPSGSGIDADKNGYNLYDVYALKSLDSGKTWIGPYNISQTKNIESTYPSMAKFVDNNLYVVYQEDSLAGGAVGGTTGSGSHLPGPVHTTNKILFAKVPVDSITNPVKPFNQAPLLTVKNLYKDSTITLVRDSNTRLLLTFIKGCNKDLNNKKAFDASKTTFLKNYVEIYDDAAIDSNNLTIITDSAFNINKPGEYGYRVFVKDNLGVIGANAGFVYLDTLFVNISVIDDIEGPQMTLNGTDPVNILINSTYTDAGATVVGDNNPCYVIGTPTTNSTVNTNTVGSYKVTYTITDNANNTTTIERTVNVGAPAIASFTSESVSKDTVKATNTSTNTPTACVWSYKYKNSTGTGFIETTLTSLTTNVMAPLNRKLASTVKEFDSLCLSANNIFNSKPSKVCKYLKYVASSISDINKTKYDVNVYPNPSQGFVNVSFNGIQYNTGATLKVFNIEGKEVFNTIIKNTTQDFPLVLDAIGAGTFIIQTEINGESNMKKIVITK